ncbi:hypothetical protein ACPOL_3160 [Acidisarcina polymorpha]|uniref:Uncharacterized protein n=1 Tax=Acidisarcina polymorpha TaxID=2211140 RepID=A0A2Z5G1D5_9BACT|nr:hypothetical protein ACPOL_3160 [Acidisarcina polymorpha]
MRVQGVFRFTQIADAPIESNLDVETRIGLKATVEQLR